MLRGMRRGRTPTSPPAPAVRSWVNRPMTGPAEASLKELSRLGMTVITSGRVMRVIDVPQVVDRMAEGQDLGAVDVGHRPHGGDVEVAADELDAHGVAFPEGGLGRALQGPELAAAPAPHGQKARRGEERPGLLESRRRRGR